MGLGGICRAEELRLDSFVGLALDVLAIPPRAGAIVVASAVATSAAIWTRGSAVPRRSRLSPSSTAIRGRGERSSRGTVAPSPSPSVTAVTVGGGSRVAVATVQKDQIMKIMLTGMRWDEAVAYAVATGAGEGEEMPLLAPLTWGAAGAAAWRCLR